MLAILAVLLLIFWGIGLATHLLGGFIHVALVLAVIFAISHFFSSRKTAS
jgi:hypothetical protein